MRVLVISDIHSNLTALETVLDDVGNFDAAICAGDIVGYGPKPEECVDVLRLKGFHCVAGNHDFAVANLETDWFNDEAQVAIRINRSQLSLANLDWLDNLPTELKLSLGGTRFTVFHGSPTQPLTSYIYPDNARALACQFLRTTGADILILGHTHIPYKVETHGKCMTNPGSVGQPRDADPRASYQIIETSNKLIEHRRVTYNIDETADAIDSLGLPHIFATRLFKGM